MISPSRLREECSHTIPAMPDSFESLIAYRDLPCPQCQYNLRGMRGEVCPECGAKVGAWLLEPPVENWTSRRFRAGRIAAGFAWAMGVTVLLFDVPRTRWRDTSLDVLEVALAGVGSILIGALWLIYARRIARAKPSRQGRIATARWSVLAILLLVALGLR